MARQKRSKARRKHKIYPITSPSLKSSPRACEVTSETSSGHALNRAEEASASGPSPTCTLVLDPVSPPAPPKQADSRLRAVSKALSRPPNVAVGGATMALEDDGFDALLEGLEGPDLRTAKLVVQALRAPEDLSRLRRLSVTHGFVNDRIRAVVWPRLLGISRPASGDLALGQPPPRPLIVRRPPPAQAPDSPAAGRPPSPGRARETPDAHDRQRRAATALPGYEASTAARQHAGEPSSLRPVPSQGHGTAADTLALASNVPAAAMAAEPPMQRPGPLGACSGLGSVSGEECGGAEGASRLNDTDGSRGCTGAACGTGRPAGAPVRGSNGCASSPRGDISDSSGSGGGTGGSGGPQARDGAAAAEPYGGSSATAASASTRSTAGKCSEERGKAAAAQGSSAASNPSASSRGPGSGPDPSPDYGNRDQNTGQTEGSWDWGRYLQWSRLPHRDSAVVEVDVARSLWAFTRGWSEEAREGVRRRLKRLLNSVVAAHGGDVHYYQGLHDVAGVLLLATAPTFPLACNRGANNTGTGSSNQAVGIAAGPGPSASSNGDDSDDWDSTPQDEAEMVAFALLRRLTVTHLRDATRPSLEPVVQLLGFLPYLIAAADPQLGRHLAGLGLQPYYALSWFLTWWSRGSDDLPPAARLFDFFMAGHPLMPLYLGAVAMRSQRAALLAREEMPELHSVLTNLKLVDGGAVSAAAGIAEGVAGVVWRGRGVSVRQSAAAVIGRLRLEELLRQAEQLWRAKPPHLVLPVHPSRGLPLAEPRQPLSQLRRRRGSADGGGAPHIGVGCTGRYAGGHRGARHEEGEQGPQALVLSACVSHAAVLEGEGSCALWRVPQEPPADWPAGVAAAEGRSGLVRGVLARAGAAMSSGKSRSALLSVGLLAGVYVAAAVAIGYATFTRHAEGQ